MHGRPEVNTKPAKFSTKPIRFLAEAIILPFWSQVYLATSFHLRLSLPQTTAPATRYIPDIVSRYSHLTWIGGLWLVPLILVGS